MNTFLWGVMTNREFLGQAIEWGLLASNRWVLAIRSVCFHSWKNTHLDSRRYRAYRWTYWGFDRYLHLCSCRVVLFEQPSYPWIGHGWWWLQACKQLLVFERDTVTNRYVLAIVADFSSYSAWSLWHRRRLFAECSYCIAIAFEWIRCDVYSIGLEMRKRVVRRNLKR